MIFSSLLFVPLSVSHTHKDEGQKKAKNFQFFIWDAEMMMLGGRVPECSRLSLTEIRCARSL